MSAADTRVAIFGAGGFGREVLQLVRDVNRVRPTYNAVGFLVDDGYATGADVQGLPVLGGVDWLARHPDVAAVIAVGSSAARHRIAARIRAGCGNAFATLVHPQAWVGDFVSIGAGSIVCAGALITTDIEIGEHVHVNIGATVGHDARLDDFVTLNPGVHLSGAVRLGRGAEIGTGSVLNPAVEVGAWSIVGAGTTVVKSLPGDVTAVGSPARIVKQRDSGWHETGRH